MDSIALSPYNTRLFKHDDGPVYEIKIASALSKEPSFHDYEGMKIKVCYGDHADIMARVADNIEKAIAYSANNNQAQMLDKYVKHFRGGDINDHKDAQRSWIKDVGPVVETNIGFIESYRDPFGVRGEFEGFVAIVNKDMSKKFGALVRYFKLGYVYLNFYTLGHRWIMLSHLLPCCRGLRSLKKTSF
jgi:dipeptidyl-peptidase-3